jgi:hypothetical protein
MTDHEFECPRCGHCCPQPNQEPAKDKLDFWDLFDETQRLRAELKFNTTPPTVQLEQEPVAWYDKHGMVTHDPFEGIRPLYAAPRPWVGLTNEEVTELSDFVYAGDPQYIRLIETKLREKNT